MELMFSAKGILERGKGMTFDDVLLIPQYSEISSRKHPSLASPVTKNHNIDTPIIAANMDTITEAPMAIKMAELGGLGIIHRFMSTQEQGEHVKRVIEYSQKKSLNSPIAASIGVKEDGMKRADYLVDCGVQLLVVDIAHGDSVMMYETLEYVKKKHPSVDVIAGNVATPQGVQRMIDSGADAVKVGIGPGSMCTTRLITGHGVPQLTAIAMCVEQARKHKVPVIADGGIKNSGDMVKAFCAGASTIMVGSLLAGTMETPGEIKGGMKRYRGMASKDAQVSWRGELPKGMAAEGEATMIPCKGSAEHVVSELTGGIRSGMTYVGASTVSQMYDKAQFMLMSAAGYSESKPHGLRG